jgi:NAD(P)H-dependent FMN reductase
MTTALTIGILAGSTRIGSQAPKVARAISNAIVAKGHKVVMWDLTTPELKSLAIVEKPFHHYKDPATPAPATMARVQAEIVASNAVIVLGGEYNHAPLPASLAFLDNFYVSLECVDDSASVHVAQIKHSTKRGRVK